MISPLMHRMQASGIESALQTALTGESLKSAGTAAAQGLGNAMTAYPWRIRDVLLPRMCARLFKPA